ncbi:MAG: hypothetical protein GQ581_00850, partial [Methyloprofundus sp.]|nr:hypothetical protein [Methyloprofundus sp.]
VDFADFLHPERPFEGNFWPRKFSLFYDRLLVDEQLQNNKNYQFNKTKDYATALFSLDALNDSLTTLISQSANSSSRTELGFNPARDYHATIRYEGAWVLFAQKQKELERRFAKTGLTIFDAKNWSFELEAVKQAIQLAHAKNIHLTLFINAYHYTYLETIKNAGYWSQFEQFKRSLAETVQKYGNNKVALWDFALYSNYTVAAVPQKNASKTALHWFWEPAHYKAELGELMLADMFAKPCVATKKDPVGIKLNTIDMNTHLLQQQNQRAVLLQNLR